MLHSSFPGLSLPGGCLWEELRRVTAVLYHTRVLPDSSLFTFSSDDRKASKKDLCLLGRWHSREGWRPGRQSPKLQSQELPEEMAQIEYL